MTEQQLILKMIVGAWETQSSRVTKLMNSLSDEKLLIETAPGRNSGFYLVGHLAAVSDALFPLLGWGEKLYPQLDNIFLKNPENSGLEKPSVSQIREYWKDIDAKVAEHIKTMPYDEWFTRHNSVSSEDFAKEPFRNKMNILINRTNHMSYHLGQMVYLTGKSE
ncbi:MAG: DinB family protein [Cyclobacteriaceae bacterium]|nr:DinB family protein [Cyclobacteriaceae bacterium]